MQQRSMCLEELRRRIARLEETRRRDRVFITSGCPPLDQALPEQGFRCGSLVEWLSNGDGTGVGTLALLAARAASDAGRLVVVMDRRGDFCPPAAVRLGIDVERLVVVQPQSAADHDWAMDQVLRSPAVAAALAWPEKLDPKTFRRWQLAAEQGGALGLLLRPASARVEPSWADVRLLVESISSRHTPRAVAGYGTRSVPATDTRRLRMVLLRCRGAADGRTIDVELDDETYRVHPVAEGPSRVDRRRLQIANG